MEAHPIGGERDLWRLWEGRLLPSELSTRDGQALRILFPGSANAGAGPDFTGALVAFGDDVAVRGDVELHLKASSWTAHGHHLDPQYAGVILHVVLLDDGEPARTVADRTVPVLALGPLLKVGFTAQPPTPTAGPCLHPQAPRPAPALVQAAMREAGRARFAARAVRWEGELAARGVEDCILQALLRAAGLGRNGDACAALAVALDGTTLEALLAATGEDRRVLATAVLLGMAGLLEQAQADDATRAAWDRHRHDWPGRPLDARHWRRFRLRPSNLPEARLRLLAALMAAHGLRGCLQAMISLVDRDPPAAGAHLVALLAPDGAGAGRSWALEAWASVLLPLLAAYGAAEGTGTLAARAAGLYASLPGGGDNQLLARMLAITGLPALPRLAVDQQGLLEIWSRHCSHQACATCPLAGTA
jgi:hypothetical protein